MRSDVDRLPKAELHCHLEGTIAPVLARTLARKNGIRLPDNLFTADEGYAWQSFGEFLRAYDGVASVLRTGDDYRTITLDYLRAAAAEGAIYVELFASPDHAEAAGISYEEMVEGCAAAIEAAERESGVVGRIIITAVRHLGPERALRVARLMAAHPHPLVVGFGMGGDEHRFEPADFAPAYRIAADSGHGCTVHAGEVRGAESIRACLDSLPMTRIGHGVRAIEDPALVDKLVRRGIHLEVCPGSNLALGIFPDWDSHPLPALLEAGVSLSLSSDDPPFFHTGIGQEYRTAQKRFGLDEAALDRLTRNALKAAFVDEQTRQRLMARLASREV